MKPKSVFFSEYGGIVYDPVACDFVAQHTGLLDQYGNPIMRQPKPIGFVTDFTPVKPVVRVKAGSQKI
jgi:hypothetical protein